MNRMSKFSKSERRHMRDLAGVAYERELESALTALHAEFKKWEAGELFPSELSERIHDFHQGPARDLYSRYNSLDEDQLVARAVAVGLIEADQVERAVLQKLEKAIEFFS